MTAGFPTLDATVNLMLALQRGGADFIELGVPHTDPIADGPTIQTSSNVALANGVNMDKILGYVKQSRKQGLTVPIVLMGYYNNILQHGEEKLVKEFKEAGGDGFIVVDLPPDSHSDVFRSYCAKNSISFIPLVTPTTGDDRLAYINSVVDQKNSFVYCVSVTGVTGGRSQLPTQLPEFMERVNRFIHSPKCIGFGISTPELFESVGQLADGVVVGSALIKCITAAGADAAQKLEAFVSDLTKSRRNADGSAKRVKTATNGTNGNAAPVPELPKLLPNSFGPFGGTYAPETLQGALRELEEAYVKVKDDPSFHAELKTYYSYVGRPTPMYFAERLTEQTGGAKIWIKREDLAHTGAHKINNAIGQALLAKRLGKKRIIAETGAGQHGVATATVCAKLGLECVVYMGAEDIQRQSLNVFRMKILGATVVGVESGSRTLKDAINEAMRDWVTNIRTTHYLVGSAIGPHPFPTIVRDFQSVIGSESRQQSLDIIGKLPNLVVACVGGGSNAIGMFYPFVEDKDVKLLGVEAGGKGVTTEEHSATICKGTPGVLHGTKTLLIQADDGQILGTHSVSAGLDYPGVGPEHAFLHWSKRAEYIPADDEQCMMGFRAMSLAEGIIPALETSHAIFHAIERAKKMPKDDVVLICMSGRGDKDMGTVAKVEGVTLTQ